MAGACGGAKNGDLMYVISRDRPGMCISPVITHSRAHMHFTFPITGETCLAQAVSIDITVRHVADVACSPVAVAS